MCILMTGIKNALFCLTRKGYEISLGVFYVYIYMFVYVCEKLSFREEDFMGWTKSAFDERGELQTYMHMKYANLSFSDHKFSDC